MHESGKTLDEIVQAVKKVTDIVAEIAAASREQSSGIEQVNRAVMQMDETTQQNAALVEQAAAASEAIVEQAKALNSVIARYKINDAAQPANPAVQPAAPARSSERRGRDRAWSKTKAAIAPSAPLAAEVPRSADRVTESKGADPRRGVRPSGSDTMAPGLMPDPSEFRDLQRAQGRREYNRPRGFTATQATRADPDCRLLVKTARNYF